MRGGEPGQMAPTSTSHEQKDPAPSVVTQSAVALGVHSPRRPIPKLSLMQPPLCPMLDARSTSWHRLQLSHFPDFAT